MLSANNRQRHDRVVGLTGRHSSPSPIGSGPRAACLYRGQAMLKSERRRQRREAWVSQRMAEEHEKMTVDFYTAMRKQVCTIADSEISGQLLSAPTH